MPQLTGQQPVQKIDKKLDQSTDTDRVIKLLKVTILGGWRVHLCERYFKAVQQLKGNGTEDVGSEVHSHQ